MGDASSTTTRAVLLAWTKAGLRRAILAASAAGRSYSTRDSTRHASASASKCRLEVEVNEHRAATGGKFGADLFDTATDALVVVAQPRMTRAVNP